MQGQKDCERLVDEMETLGGQLMLRKVHGNRTATEESNQEAKGDSVLHTIVNNLEAALAQAFRYTQLLRGVQGEVPVVSLYKDFSLQNPNHLSAKDLLDAVNSQRISESTYWDNMKQLGLKSDRNVEDEQEEISQQVANLPAVTDVG